MGGKNLAPISLAAFVPLCFCIQTSVVKGLHTYTVAGKTQPFH